MTFYKVVGNSSILENYVPALESYLPNSIIYIVLYLLALPPNILLAYMGIKEGVVNARVKYPTLGMTLANLFGLFGFLRTFLYNTTYVSYFLFPVLAIDQWLLICHNCDMSIKSLTSVILICFTIPMGVAFYDLWLQDVVLYDFMFNYIRMSPYTNVFFFFVLAPSFFVFSFICNLLVLSSIMRRQSKSTRVHQGRSLNPRQLQQQKAIVYAYILLAFMPLVLATPYYIANVLFMLSIDLNMIWFIVSEAIIGCHPLSNGLITLLLLRPYRSALQKMIYRPKACVPFKSSTITNVQFMEGDSLL